MADGQYYTTVTFGCHMNDRDSEVIAGLLEDMGYRRSERIEDADVVIVNTCCVRESAERKIYGRIGDLKRLKEEKPDMIIGVGGCMTQQEGAGPRLSRDYPHVDLVFGTHNLHQLPALIKQVQATRRSLVDVWEREGEVVERRLFQRKPGLKGFVNITFGCNNFCTYCIVPYVRGRERSRQPEAIVAEVEEMVRLGYKEVTLLGQNVNTYGRDLAREFDFGDLLLALDQVRGLGRIRYTTSHPRDFSDRLISIIAASDKVCEHFHLPVQAGSNRVLARMNRGYTRAHYLDLVRRIRDAVPGASITTDIIVGFPGETEEDFQDTLDLVRRARFDAAFTFMFSPRSGTPAARMVGQLSREVKQDRLQRLLAVQCPISLDKNRELVGREVEVLVEGTSKKNPDMLSGRTRTNKIVHFQGDTGLVGRLERVVVCEAHTWSLRGRLKSHVPS